MKVKKKKAKLLAGLFLLFCCCMAGGCAEKLTPEKLMGLTIGHMAGLRSFSTEVDFDIELEEVVHTTAVALDMTMENTTEPRAGHARGTASIKMRNTSLQSELEIYQVAEEDGYVTYSGMDGSWKRQVSPEGGQSAAIPIDGSFFDRMREAVASFHIAGQAVEVNGKACWQMFGNVTGKDLMGLLGKEMLYAYGLIDIPDTAAVDGMEIPIIFEIYQDEILPARMFIDMTDVMEQMYDEIGEPTRVNTFTIKLSFSRYDQVGEIVVPEDVRKAAQDQSSLTIPEISLSMTRE